MNFSKKFIEVAAKQDDYDRHSHNKLITKRLSSRTALPKENYVQLHLKESLFAILLFGLFLKIHGFIGITHAFDEFVPGIQFAGADACA